MEYEPLKKVTLTEQVMERLAGMITSGQLKRGTSCPMSGIWRSCSA